MPRPWMIPEGLRVLPDGSWRIGELPVLHDASLRYMKARLMFDAAGAFVEDAGCRMPVVVEGPAFEAVALRLDPERGEARAVLDDGTEEAVTELGMSESSGRFECRVRGGRAGAVLSRAAHQTLLEQAEEDGGTFFLRVGPLRIPIRT